MRQVRRLAALIVRGPSRQFVRQDLDEMYERDRERGMSRWDANWRYGRRLAASAVDVWRDDVAAACEWIAEARSGATLQDLRFGVRLFLKHPAPVAIAASGLALAIGVVSSVFSVVDATMLRPYGMKDPGRVVSVAVAGERGFPYWPYARFLTMQRSSSLSRVEASDAERVRVGTTPAAESERERHALFVSGGYLRTLGASATRGRTLDPSDAAPAAPLVAVVSHRFWQRDLNGDPSVVGKTIWINGTATTIVGVLSGEFTGPVREPPSIWMALGARGEVTGGPSLTPESSDDVEVIARLAPGASIAAARDNLSAIVSHNRPPDLAHHAVELMSAASPASGRYAGDAYAAVAVFFTVVGLVLAVACANTANLLLAAATTRAREMGVRLAMGADRRRLIRQLLNESLLLGVVSGGLGLLFATWFAPVLQSVLELSGEVRVSPDGRSLLFTIAVAVVCGLGAGLSAARHGAGGRVLEALKSQSGPRVGRSRLRTSFIGFQAAVATVLLVAASLLARTFIHLAHTDVGFDAERLLSVSPERQLKGFDEEAYLRDAVAAIGRVPGVERVALSETLPWGSSRWVERFTLGGRFHELMIFRADEQFLGTLGVRVLRGRAYTREEATQQAPVALISENIARAFFPGTDPIGRSTGTLPSSLKANPATIVGVVGEAMVTRNDAQVTGAIYQPISRTRSNPVLMVVRSINPLVTARGVVDALRHVNPSVRVGTRPVSDGLDSFRTSRRIVASLAAPLAALTALLAGVGVFGVTVFIAGQRTQEVSLRLAIGASASDIVRLLAIDSIRPVLIGSAAGLFAALVVSRFAAREMLGGVSPFDPISISMAVAIVVLSAAAAVAVPVLRAAHVDPARLLRES